MTDDTEKKKRDAPPKKILRLSPGTYEKTQFNVYSGQTIHGEGDCRLQGMFVCKKNLGTVTFENITFVSIGETLVFCIPGNVLFQNCKFLLEKADSEKNITLLCLSKGNYMITNGSMTLNSSNVEKLSAITVTKRASLTVRSFHIAANLHNVPVFSILSAVGNSTPEEANTLATNGTTIVVRTQSERSGTQITLVRNRYHSIVSVMATTILFESGKGTLVISNGDSLAFVNALTVAAKSPKEWSIGDYKHLLLASFVSNIAGCSDLTGLGVIEPIEADEEGYIDDNEMRNMLSGADTWR
jgi:hypothetical protein